MREARPATLEDLKRLVAALNEAGADYILIGGYALFAHGYHRTTVGIDLLVRPSAEAGRRVVQALLVLPDKAAREIRPEWFEEGDNIRVADEIVVDVMFNAAGETWDSLQPYVQTVDLDGVPVRTLSLEGLLRTKASAREKDIADCLVLDAALAAARVNRER